MSLTKLEILDQQRKLYPKYTLNSSQTDRNNIEEKEIENNNNNDDDDKSEKFLYNPHEEEKKQSFKPLKNLKKINIKKFVDENI